MGGPKPQPAPPELPPVKEDPKKKSRGGYLGPGGVSPGTLAASNEYRNVFLGR